MKTMLYWAIAAFAVGLLLVGSPVSASLFFSTEDAAVLLAKGGGSHGGSGSKHKSRHGGEFEDRRGRHGEFETEHRGRGRGRGEGEIEVHRSSGHGAREIREDRERHDLRLRDGNSKVRIRSDGRIEVESR